MQKSPQLPFKIIDLTYPLDEKTLGWEGAPGFHAHLQQDYAKGCRVLQYTMVAGIGTHMDAPSHFIEGGEDIDEIPVENFLRPLCVLHIPKEPSGFISVEELEEDEKAHGMIPPGSIVVANTGWAKRWKDPAAYRNANPDGILIFPGFSKEAAEFLLNRQIVGLGIDALSPDGSNQAFSVHHLLLKKGLFFLENLTNLEQLPARGAFLAAFPPKIKGGSEVICRVVALV